MSSKRVFLTSVLLAYRLLSCRVSGLLSWVFEFVLFIPFGNILFCRVADSRPTRNAHSKCLILDETMGSPESLDQGAKKLGQICEGCNSDMREPDCLTR